MLKKWILTASLAICAACLVTGFVQARDREGATHGQGHKAHLVTVGSASDMGSCSAEYARWQHGRSDAAMRRYLACRGW